MPWKNKTTEEFIADAKKKHGSKYDYSKSNYKGSDKPVTIICKKHGSFNQIAGDHTQGHGCTDCGKDARSKKKTLSKKEVIKRFKKMHSSRYGYSKVLYKDYLYVSSTSVELKKHFNKYVTDVY